MYVYWKTARICKTYCRSCAFLAKQYLVLKIKTNIFSECCLAYLTQDKIRTGKIQESCRTLITTRYFTVKYNLHGDQTTFKKEYGKNNAIVYTTTQYQKHSFDTCA